MSPILVCQAFPVDPGVNLGFVVSTKAAPQRQIVGALKRIHTVELQASGLLQMARKGGARQCPGAAWFRVPLQVQPQPGDSVYGYRYHNR